MFIRCLLNLPHHFFFLFPSPSQAATNHPIQTTTGYRRKTRKKNSVREILSAGGKGTERERDTHTLQ
jgi:hypothetical protein